MRILTRIATVTLLSCVALAPCLAADNALTAEEKAAGWELLFNGKDYNDWFIAKGDKQAKPNMTLEDGCLVALKSGGYIIYHKKQFGDFVLKCDVKMATKRVNSGIFCRVGEPGNPVQTGLEVQVSTGRGSGSHNYGAIYDVAKAKIPVPQTEGGWDHIVLTCKGPKIKIEINGKLITEMNCDEYTEARKNPDGSKNKYRKPLKDFPREGYIGFQDHHDNTKAMYKNIKILDLKKAKK